MNYDLEYFTEFLNDPSAFGFVEFYEMAKKWCEYITEHKDEFNYLKDDDWKETRERLVAEFKIRELFKQEIEREWEETCEIHERWDEASDQEIIDSLEKQLALMKNYGKLYEFTDDDVKELERDIELYREKMRQSEVAEANLLLAQHAVDKSIADLDESLAKIQQRTGKTPILSTFSGKEKPKGN